MESKINELLAYTGQLMECGAVHIKYSDSDEELIAKLDLENRDVHRFVLKQYIQEGHSVDAVRKRNERLQLDTVKQTIRRLDCIKVDEPANKNLYPKMYPVQTPDGVYNVPADQLKTYALAVEEELEYVYRAAGKCFQFFEKDVFENLPPLHISVLRTFFSNIYKGPFILKQSGYFAIYINEHLFSNQNAHKKSMHYFSCQHGGGCNARVYLTILNGQLIYHFSNHSENLAHNHCDTPAHSNIEPIETPATVYVPPAEKLSVSNLSRKNFVTAGLAKYVEGKQQIVEDATGFFYQLNNLADGGIRVWKCRANLFDCTARAFTMVVNNQERVVFDKLEVHRHKVSTEKTRKTLRNLKNIRDEEFTEAVQIITSPRGSQNLMHGKNFIYLNV